MLKGHLDLLLLPILRDGPRHGYALIEELRGRRANRFDLPEGTVYPALHRLERQGFLASDWDRSTGRRRRVYTLTSEGLEALAAQRWEWERLTDGVRSVLGGLA